MGCSGASSPAITPITAIDIDIADLLNSANLGCGEGAYDVYEYGVLVTLEYPGGGVVDTSCVSEATGVVAAGAFKCYANAVFGNLPSLPDGGALPDGGSASFRVQVFLYNYDTFERNGGMGPITAAVAYDAGTADTLCSPKLSPTWIATCTANEQGNIEVNAKCGPILPFLAGDAAADASPDR